MREIKFRGKTLHSDEWCFGSLVDYGDGEMEIQGFDVFREGVDEWEEMSIDLDTLGQFTGMCDCEGNEIFEGDIVRTSIAKDDIGLVEWNSERSAFVVHMKGSSQCYPLDKRDKIIGNIHDTPSLLEGGQQ